MPPIQFVAEIWNRQNTARLAFVRDLLVAERARQVGGPETLKIEVAFDDPAAPSIGKGAVVRLSRPNTTEFSLYRVAGRTTSRSAESRRRRAFKCEALWADLRFGRVAMRTRDGLSQYEFGLVGLTAAQYVNDFIIPAANAIAPGFTLVAGVIEPAGTFDLTFSRTSPLDALRQLETESKGELAFRWSPDGLTLYVDLLTRLGQTYAGGGKWIRYEKNLRGIEKEEDDAQVATRGYGSGGGGLTLADAEYTIAGVAADVTYGATHRLSFSGEQVIVWFVGAYTFGDLWFFIPGKGAYQVVGQTTSGNRVYIQQGANPLPAANDVGYYTTDAAGAARLDYLDDPVRRAALGIRTMQVDDPEAPDAVNLLRTGDFSTWQSGMPTFWTKTHAGVVVAQETSRQVVQVGTYAARVTTTAADQGIISTAFTIPAAVGRRPYLGFAVGCVLALGSLRVELRHSNGNVYPLEKRPQSAGLGTYLTVAANAHDEPLPAGTAQLAIVSNGGAADFYVDSAIVTPIVADTVPAFVLTNGAYSLVSCVKDALADRGTLVEYRVDLLDLYRADPEAYQFDRIDLGDDVRLYDPEIEPGGTVAGTVPAIVRVVEIEEDLLTATATRVVLAPGPKQRPPNDLDALLPLRKRKGRVSFERESPTRTGVKTTRVLWAAAQIDAAGSAYVTAQGDEYTAAMRVYTKTTRAGAYTLAATIVGRTGSYGPINVPPGSILFFRVEALDASGNAGSAYEDLYSRAEGTPPVPLPRWTLNTARTAADVTVRVESGTGEAIRLRVRDTNAASAVVWSSVVGNGNATPLFQATANDFAPTTWFTDGATYAQKLLAVPLLRDQNATLYVQAEGSTTGLRSAWVAVPLEVREQPWLESVDLTFDEATDQLRFQIVGGAFCRSARVDLATSDAFTTILSTTDVTVADGGSVVVAIPIAAGDRGALRVARATPYNGPLSGGAVTGQPGVANRDSELVPLLPVVPPNPPTAKIEFVTGTATSETVRFTGALGTGGAGPRRYRYRIDTLGNAPVVGTWSAWSTGALPTDLPVLRNARWSRRVYLEVEDQASGVVASDAYGVESRSEAIGDDGRIDRNQPWSGTARRPVDTDNDAIAGRGADNDLSTAQAGGYVDRASGRVLRLRDSDTGQDVTGSVIADGARRSRSGLSTSGRVSLGVDRTADIAGISAGLVSRAAASAYLETFESFDPGAWLVRGGDVSAASIVAAGQTGGNALRLNAFVWLVPDVLIPFDPSKVYRLRVRVRANAGGTPALFYAGFEGVGADRVTLVSTNGTNQSGNQHYIAATDETVAVSAEYSTYTGWVRGSAAAGSYFAQPDARLPGAMHQAARYIRPLIVANYNGGTGGTQAIDVDEVSIDVHDEDLVARGYDALTEDGDLRSSVVKLNNGRGYPVGTLLGAAQLTHGAAINFVPPLDRPVRLCYAGGGRPYVAAWASLDQCLDIGVDNATSSGGTLRALVRQLAGSLNDRRPTPDATTKIVKNPFGQAYNDRYDFRYTVSLPSVYNPKTGVTTGSRITLGFYTLLPGGGVWTKADERMYSNYTGSIQSISDNFEVARDGLGAEAQFKIVVESVVGTASHTFTELRFMEGTAPLATSMTPTGSDPVTIQFIAD